MNNPQTFRTTKMLEHAVQLAEDGRAVYILGASPAHLTTLKQQLGEELALKLGIKFETEDTIDDFDWQSMTLKYGHPNCVVLVDHWCIEWKFSKMLKMLHAYD